MAAKTGASTNIVAAKGATFGTAVSGGAGSKLLVESLSHSRNAEMLTSNPIGSGLEMQDDVELGTENPSVSVSVMDRYDGAGNVLEALFFQGASVVAGATSTYTHSFLFNATRNAAFGTIAFEPNIGSIIEYASCTPTKLTFGIQPDNYVTKSIDLIADKQVLTGTVNTNASVLAATASSTKKVTARASDKFRFNRQTDAALSDTNVLNIKSADITYTYQAEAAVEIKNSAGVGLPTVSGTPPFTAEIKVTLRNNQDLYMFTAAQAGYEFKADLSITSSYMAGGAVPYKKVFYFPRLKLMNDPELNLTSPGDNPVTLTFTALVATAIPSGMANVYPHNTVTNATAAAYL